MNKYLFLDIDGVLNGGNWIYSRDYLNTFSENDFGVPIDNGYPENRFDPSKILIVKRIVESTKCMIILSSDWRTYDSLDNPRSILIRYNSVKDLLSSLGLNISGYTPIGKSRGLEIKEYLDGLIYKDYVYCILDDIDEFLPEQYDYLVKTKWSTGITEEDSIKVIKILNKND